MMKIIFFILFMIFMLMGKNYMVMFYYNLCFILSLMIICGFMSKWGGYMWLVSMYMGFDSYSIFLAVLSVWIIGLMFMSIDLEEINMKIKLMIFIFMLLILMMFFGSMNLMMFYLFFEIILIPTFFLVVYWGMNPERISAALYLLMYMLVFSLPLLYYIFIMLNKIGSLDMIILEVYFLENEWVLGAWGMIIILGVFLVKLPIYMFHIWLPKAHVEAPVYGSMILAGILLKLGGYGLLRLLSIMISKCINYNYMIFSVGLVGSLFISVVSLVQVDMKSLVAYSSVVHMNMMLSALCTLLKLGFMSAFIMMIAHGLCSSGLFYMVNLYYKWSSSRLLMLNKGMLNLFPSLSMWWFLFCVANFSFPLSLNFISEIFMISSIVNWEMIFMIYLMVICFLSGAYSLYLYAYVQHGDNIDIKSKMYIGYVKEFMVIINHFYPLLLLLLNLIMFM